MVTLTGTDLYQDLGSSSAVVESLQAASRLVLLQPAGVDDLPARLRRKARVILQSAEPPLRRLPPLKRSFEVCVSGHLRPVKDPFRAAEAARRLPGESRIRITHLGGALSTAMEQRALAQMQHNRRYRWLGEVSAGRARQLLDRSRLLVLSSKSEGGANVVSEAVVCGVPVLSTRIAGSIGLLGEDYPGYFEVGDTAELARLLWRAESEPSFLKALTTHCRRVARQFTPAKEKAAWSELLKELLSV